MLLITNAYVLAHPQNLQQPQGLAKTAMVIDRATDTESEISVQGQNSEGQSNEETGCTPATGPSQNQKIHDDLDKGSDSKREVN
jgi:hypothetical protein